MGKVTKDKILIVSFLCYLFNCHVLHPINVAIEHAQILIVVNVLNLVSVNLVAQN